MLVVDFYKIPIGVSLGVVAGILILSVVASLLIRRHETGMSSSRRGLEKFKTRRWPHPMAIPGYAKVGAVILLIAAVLGIAKCDSITAGPSGDNAIVAIRIVQRELVEAQQQYGKSDAPKLNVANATLAQAWSKLAEKRYAEAISAAQKARELLRTLP